MNKDLFSGFPYTTAKEWLTRIARDLKDRDPAEMQWSPDGELTISPYLHAEHVACSTSPISSFGQWSIGESIVVTDETASNAQILRALNSGVESVHLSCIETVHWDTVFAGVELPYIHVGLNIIGDRDRALENFIAYSQKHYPSEDLRITVYGANIPGMTHSRFCSQPFVADQISNELGLTINSALESADLRPAQIAMRDLSVNVGIHFLVEIARLRALRILWSNVASALAFPLSSEFAIEAYTKPCKAEDDPYTHMIRSTIMGLSAILGGADRVYISPAIGIPADTEFYHHIAHNIHHILRYESKLPEMEDPIAGAYYVDQLTMDIIRRSWDGILKNIK